MQNVIKSFLQLNKYYTLQNDFEDYFLSHPNYPSLYAVTDTLTLIGIDNIAAKIPKEQFFELPESFLAFYNKELVLIEKEKEVVVITNEKAKKEKIKSCDFLDGWDGIAVAINSNDNDNEVFQNKNYFKEIVFSILVVFFLANSYFTNTLSYSTIIEFTLIGIGLLLSILILEEKYHKNNQTSFTSKLCSFNDSLSCDKVIQSKQAIIFKWLSFSDLPIIFFATSIIVILIHPDNVSFIGFLSLTSYPLIIYSIWVQKKELRKWCFLCLSISSIIILTSFFSQSFINNPNGYSVFLFMSILVVISFFWLSYENIIVRKTELLNNNRQLLNFKRNPTVYKFLSKPVLFIESLNTLQPIRIGNSNSPIVLRLIISPSCSHCHKAYQEALNLVSNFPDRITLNIFFNVNPDNYDNPFLKVILNLLQMHSSTSLTITKKALDDWHLKKMTLEKWLKKWEQVTIEESVIKQLLMQYNWCQENGLNYAPVKIVNESLYPNEYTISELRFFMSEIENEIELV